ncbi:MAG TPA: tRNA (adenosine(37)-N6)-threonylcarbamoyltransferase complex dimerization subunit type 1 TsaB, partial [Firmicutes bacterium]|nr:tRNA (adenosine(37)-N6)-threonylcarbamoyltransferase complex dimerization subunit type 1 TsaB [Bacillota bacterium]
MVLLLDSSGNHLVAGLADPRRGVVAEAAHPAGTVASRDLSAVVEDLLEAAGCGVPDSVIAGTGPGTFIGTRMAVSFANGLAAATGCELRGVGSLAAFAA